MPAASQSQPRFPQAFEVEWTDTPLASVAPDKVRLQANVTGISMGTELMWYDGSAPALVSGRKSYPYTPGYEFVGHVVEVGEDTRDEIRFPRLSRMNVGDRVFAMKPHARFADFGENEAFVRLDDTVSDENALGLALTCTCLHAYHRAHPSLGVTAGVVGFGVVGAIMVQVARAAGCADVYVSTRSKEKQDQAVSLGATAAFAPSEFETGAPQGFAPCDVVFECTGKSPGVETALRMAGNQAKIAATGFYTEPMPVDGEALFAKELTLLGVRASGAPGARTEYVRWPRSQNLELAAHLAASGAVRVADLVTHRFAPSDLAQAYDMARSGSEPYGLALLEWRE